MELSDANIMQNILNIGRSRERAVYFRSDGTKTLPLPADPYSKMYYMSKGFTLTPPQDNTVRNDGAIICPIPHCGFEAKSALGLRSHLRKHINKSEKEV